MADEGGTGRKVLREGLFRAKERLQGIRDDALVAAGTHVLGDSPGSQYIWPARCCGTSLAVRQIARKGKTELDKQGQGPGQARRRMH